MPAPRPSITPSVGAKLGNAVNAAAKRSSRMPATIASSDENSVSAIAAAERNTSVSTSTATAMPMSSPTGAVCCAAWSTIWPRRSTSTPARWAVSLARSSALPGACLRSIAGLSYWTVANAIRPSREIDPPRCASGSPADVTCGCRRTCAIVARIAAARAESRSVPRSTLNTIVAVSPDCAGKREARRSYALWDWVPGVLKSSENRPPARLDTAPMATTTATRIASERFQWAAVAAAMRPRRSAMPGRMTHAVRKCNVCKFADCEGAGGIFRPTMSEQQAAAQAGLRERKKQRTREAIVDAAFELFAQRGFEATTIADIAAAADIAPRTFFGYFATKEDVVTHDFAAVEASMRERLTNRAPGETTIDALREWVAGLMRSIDFDD